MDLVQRALQAVGQYGQNKLKQQAERPNLVDMAIKALLYNPDTKRLFPSSPYHAISDAQKIEDPKAREQAMIQNAMNMVTAATTGSQNIGRGKANYLPKSNYLDTAKGKFEFNLMDEANKIIKNFTYDSDLMAKAQVNKVKGTLQAGQKLSPVRDITEDAMKVVKAQPPKPQGVIPKETKLKIDTKALEDTGWASLDNGNTKGAIEDRLVDDITAEKYFDGEMPYTISTIESKVSKTGSATDMVKQVQAFAKEQGKPIIITPDARPSRISEAGTKTPLSQEQLVKWYKKLGFKEITSGEEKGAMYWRPDFSQSTGGVPRGGVKK